MKRLLVLSVTTIAVLSASIMASADRLEVNDPRGDGVRLDIDRASHAHDGRRLRHGIVTYRRWTRGDLASARFPIWLPDDDDAVDRTVVIRPNPEGGWRAVVRRGSAGAVTGPARVRRPDRRTLIVSFARSALARRLASYEWRALMYWNCQSSLPPGSPICTPPPPDRTRRVTHDL